MLPKAQLCQGNPHPTPGALLTSGRGLELLFSLLGLKVGCAPRSPSLGSWLCSPEGGREGCTVLPLLLCFLADLGSVPSPPCSSVPICTEQPGPGCTISPALCASGRMRSCKVMLSSPSPKLRVDFHLLRPLSSSVPSPPSFPCSVTLMGQAGPSQPG